MYPCFFAALSFFYFVTIKQCIYASMQKNNFFTI